MSLYKDGDPAHDGAHRSHTTASGRTDKSLGALFSDLTRETVELITKEIALARSEVSQKVSTAQAAVTAVAIGAAVLLAGLFILLQAVVNGVAMVLPPELAPWLAPLIVGLVVALIGFAMLKGGSNKLSAEHLMPRRTMESLRRDKDIAQERLS